MSNFEDLRSRAAIAAMQGLLSDKATIEVCMGACDKTGIDIQTVVARNAVSYADALIKELKEQYEQS